MINWVVAYELWGARCYDQVINTPGLCPEVLVSSPEIDYPNWIFGCCSQLVKGNDRLVGPPQILTSMVPLHPFQLSIY